MKPKHKVRHVARTAILCSAAVLALGTGQAVAEDDTNYQVAAIKDAAYGHLIIKEKFGTAIDRLEDRDRRGIDGFYAATNLCVAYIKTGELSLADTSCNMAVEKIETVLHAQARNETATESGIKRLFALALSNRGVAYAFSGRPAMAQADFKAAEELESRIKEPAINLAKLSSTEAPGA